MRFTVPSLSWLSLSLALAVSGCLRFPTNDPIANCVEQYKIYCAFAYQCCVDEDEREKFAGFAFVAHRSEGECVDAYTNLCEALGTSQRISVERGRIEPDADKIQGCLDARREAKDECDLEAFLEENDDCNEQFVGVVEDGDTCISSSECAEGGTCEIETNDEGDPRDVDEELAVGEGECVEPPGEGDACPDYVCAEGLFCDGETCRRLPGEGDPCPEFICAEGLGCADPNGDFEYTCEELLANGQSCTDDGECRSDFCDPAEGVCAALPDGDDEDLDYCEG